MTATGSGEPWAAVRDRPPPAAAPACSSPPPRTIALVTVLASPALVLLALHNRHILGYAAAGAVGTVSFVWPRAAPAVLVAVLAAAAPAGAAAVTVGCVATVGLAVGFRLITGTLRGRLAHALIALLAVLLVAAYVFPAALTPTGAADHVYRSAELIGTGGGLVMLAVTVACAPRPLPLAKAIALAGAASSLCALAVGDHVDGRLQALTVNANYLGELLAMPLVAAVGLAAATHRPVWLLSALPCLAGITATESRGAFISAIAGTVVIASRRRTPRFQTGTLLASTVVAALSSGVFGTIQKLLAGDRPAADLARSREVRRQAADFAAQAATQHPVRGIGFAAFPGYAADMPGLGTYVAVHDDYLRLAAETGLVTLGVFVALLVLAIRRAGTGAVTVLRAVVITYAVGLLFTDTLSNLTVSAPFWAALGCLLARTTAPGTGGRTGDPAAITHEGSI